MTRLFLIACLALFAGAVASVVLLPVLPAAAQGWHLPELPVGAMVFALACALVLCLGRSSTPPSRPEPFND